MLCDGCGRADCMTCNPVFARALESLKMLTDNELRTKVREFINKETLASKIGECEAAIMATNVCQDLADEYNMLVEDLSDD